jgi:cytoskeletal protein RodZ
VVVCSRVKYKIKNLNKSKKNTWSALLIIAVVLVLGASFVAYTNNAKKESKTLPDETSTNLGQDVNLQPATEQEKEAAARNKAKIIESQAEHETQNGKIKVEPVITFAGFRDGNIEVRSYISEIYESTGTCTATFSKAGSKVSKTVESIKDATVTLCDRVVVSPDEFDLKGSWTLVVRYSSPKAYGSSTQQEVVVE